jgi:hypothetical protein
MIRRAEEVPCTLLQQCDLLGGEMKGIMEGHCSAIGGAAREFGGVA